MNPSHLFAPIFQWALLLIPMLLIIRVLKSSWMKGIFGELMVKLAARLYLPERDYHRFHDVTLMTEDGSTQIDHVFVSRFGVFVVETKNMTGWIFGSERQAKWTQKIYRKSYVFQNPLRQNYKHVKAIESALGLAPDLIFSVVAFVGDSRFKSPMPDNVTQGGDWARYVLSRQVVMLTEQEVERICHAIQDGRLMPSLQTTREHVRGLKVRHAAAARAD